MTQSSASPLLVFDFSCPEGRPRRICLTRPSEIIVAHSAEEIRTALRAVERATERGLYAAGYVAYEAAPAFDTAFAAHHDTTMPLLWFGIFDGPTELDALPSGGRFQLSGWTPTVSRAVYQERVATIREAIASGDAYQVNYTLRLRSGFEGDDFAFYEHLHGVQPTRYGAYLKTGRHRILSASPELFFRRQGSRIMTRPMKGTIGRGRWPEEDDALSAWLQSSAKNQAENVMIVDLLRNDLGRIAEIGSVSVPSLYEVERYPTVFQMTSTVTAELRPEITLEEIFAALFPCGSVTGAPKVSATRFIRALEDTPRSVYCGAIGMIEPYGEAVFNVAIRTVLIDSLSGLAEYGVGGGITWDSSADEEYAEVLDKAALLTQERPLFALLETMRLEGGRYFLLEEHLQRLNASAEYFDVPLSREGVRHVLEDHAGQFPDGVRRVRLLVSQNGEVRVESEPLDLSRSAPQLVGLAKTPVERRERFLFHKTTRRTIYDSRRSECPDVFDVLLWNEEGELTEFTNGNLVLELDGRRWTPPRECGLLAGTFRADLLRRGEIRERVLARADLGRATRCWLINSVRGWVEVSFARREP
jgi:para-aminobenzoate synthetase/4-amino-4-deoxychorismate lyase